MTIWHTYGESRDKVESVRQFVKNAADTGKKEKPCQNGTARIFVTDELAE